MPIGDLIHINFSLSGRIRVLGTRQSRKIGSCWRPPIACYPCVIYIDLRLSLNQSVEVARTRMATNAKGVSRLMGYSGLID